MEMHSRRLKAWETSLLDIVSTSESPSPTRHTDSILSLIATPKVWVLEAQLQIAMTEKMKLLDLLTAEKEEKWALMPPVDEKRRAPNWLLRLVGAR